MENFLILHQSIQTNHLHLKLSYKKDVFPILFIPLVLITLTENIIKHGLLEDQLKPADIRITYENSILYIETSHYVSMEYQSQDYNASLKNIGNRLSLAYGERAMFDFHLDAENYFQTSITVLF